MRDEPPSLTSVRPDVPADFERIVSRCLEKQPSDRFQTALEVANELRTLRRALERGERRWQAYPRRRALLPWPCCRS